MPQSGTISPIEEQKRSAALRAAEWIEDGMVLGLGTGSTMSYLLDRVGERRKVGELRSISAVPTSIDTETRASALGIRVLTLEQSPTVDLTIDGADEVDPRLNLIKGLGGALLREKIVAVVSRRMIIMVDHTKRVAQLGARSPLPIEVEPFGLGAVLPALARLGAVPVLRTDPRGEPVRTDGNHLLVDCRFDDGIPDPYLLDRALQACPGVLETGLFLDLADTVVVASPDGVETLHRADAEVSG